MLNPYDRRQFLESLRPPPGYELDCAIGTTFSLDLFALLTASLAFTFFDWENEDGGPVADPLALLEAIRRSADKISVFCQAGHISIPGGNKLLWSYLEDSVIEVMPPHHHGVFHPKVWLLRFTASNGPVHYRLLCLSRNLTFDRSWDTLLVLDGIVTEDEQPMTSPICDFVAALPQMAHRPIPERVLTQVERIWCDTAYVRFELPPGFASIQFWPIGLAQTPCVPFPKMLDRILIMSPFLSDDRLVDLTEPRTNNVLVSQPDSLASLRLETRAGFMQTFVLSPAANPEELLEEAGVDEHSEALVGLHAKLYVGEIENDAHIWTGSANATQAAFERNVEFLVELTGPRQRFGIDALLEQANETSFRDLLQPYIPDRETPTRDPVMERLEQQILAGRQALASAEIEVAVRDIEVDQRFQVDLQMVDRSIVFPSDVTVRCWPITLHSEHATILEQERKILATFILSFDALTSFYAFELTARQGNKTSMAQFVLNLHLVGAPRDRRERVLRALLRTRGQVLRLLLLLLADNGHDLSTALKATQRLLDGTASESASGVEFPLFEALVRALDQNPERLAHIARLVEDLRATPEGRALLPDDFDAIWDPILATWEEVQQ